MGRVSCQGRGSLTQGVIIPLAGGPCARNAGRATFAFSRTHLRGRDPCKWRCGAGESDRTVRESVRRGSPGSHKTGSVNPRVGRPLSEPHPTRLVREPGNGVRRSPGERDPDRPLPRLPGRPPCQPTGLVGSSHEVKPQHVAQAPEGWEAKGNDEIAHDATAVPALRI